MALFAKQSHCRKCVKNRGGTAANLSAERRNHYRSFTKRRRLQRGCRDQGAPNSPARPGTSWQLPLLRRGRDLHPEAGRPAKV